MLVILMLHFVDLHYKRTFFNKLIVYLIYENLDAETISSHLYFNFLNIYRNICLNNGDWQQYSILANCRSSPKSNIWQQVDLYSVDL